MAHDIAVFACAGLGLIGVDDEINRQLGRLGRDEPPFVADRKARAATPAQAGLLDLIDNAGAAETEKLFGVLPRPACLGSIEMPIALAVEIFKNSVFVLEHVGL